MPNSFGMLCLLYLGTCLGIAVYMIPFFIAMVRQHDKKALIGLGNVFLGWTVIGWIACIVFALRD